MNNQNLIIYDFQILFDILREIENHLNFKLLNVSKNEYSQLQLNKINNYLIISKKKNIDSENQILIDNFPVQLLKLIETINIKFLKKNFIKQSEINLGKYKLNLNSRKMYDENNTLDLTEKETYIILFLKNSIKPATIRQLQSEVWGYVSKLETHTVETHIYRLRKKISDAFGNEDFIKSSKLGYIIE